MSKKYGVKKCIICGKPVFMSDEETVCEECKKQGRKEPELPKEFKDIFGI